MSRSIGYNAVGWNESLWAQSRCFLLRPAFDVCNPVTDSQAILYDLSKPTGPIYSSSRYSVGMARAITNAALTEASGHGNLTRRNSDAVLTQINH